MTLLDKARGSLFGGAVGDALGFEVEFSSLNGILNRYGAPGITDYALDTKGIARFSDDTQMTLFTAEGLLSAYQSDLDPSPVDIRRCIKDAYLAWFETQTAFQLPLSSSWLTHIRDLWNRRAPGNTCLSALSELKEGREVNNSSKGCGGVMRVAPIGIYFAAHPSATQNLQQTTADVAADAAHLTHHHAMSDYSSALAALLILNCILEEKTMTRQRLRAITAKSLPLAFSVDTDNHCAEEFES
ncbi:MAG: ADP-ribosylglycohydrolase family protein, partial [Muribaculaceae bacterium]|nr:ADP-ribosylglycohydrolase family protein [Muribaculaceae bacterium]